MHVRPAFAFLVLAGLVAGCSSPEKTVREIEIHIGYAEDRQTQYLRPAEIRVDEGERIRFAITNDDAPGAPDSFHDVAFRYADYGFLEHEVPAGRTVKTCIPQAEADVACTSDDFFTASETGQFKLYCEVGPLGSVNPDGTPKTRHAQMGMWGTLIVD